MGRVGILGDIHGNAEAFTAVLEALTSDGVEQLVCVGDIVGYNADAARCLDLVRRHDVRSIAGNHDLIAIGELDFSRCSRIAAHALAQTRRNLSAEDRDFLEKLPAERNDQAELLLFHGWLGDPQRYLWSAEDALRNNQLVTLAYPAARVCFFGHTHAQKAFCVRDGTALALEIGAEVALEITDDPRYDARYFANPGSVDASRKSRGERRAEFAVYDPQKHTLSFRHVPYDHRHAERKARVRGYRMNRARRTLLDGAELAWWLVAGSLRRSGRLVRRALRRSRS